MIGSKGRVHPGAQGRIKPTMRPRKRRYTRGCLRNASGAWVLKYYDPEAVQNRQRAHTLGPSEGPGRLTENEAQRLQDEFMRPLNHSRKELRYQATFGEFVENVYLPDRRDPEMKNIRAASVD